MLIDPIVLQFWNIWSPWNNILSDNYKNEINW